MYTHNIDPILFHLGPVEIRYYGLVYVIGLLLVYFLLNKYKEDLNLRKEGQVETFLVIVFAGLLVGARIVHFLFSEPILLLTKPWILLMVWKGGMSFFGALVGIIIAGGIYGWKKKLPFWKLADFLVIPAIFVLGIGRIANFINGEIVGTVATVSWCVVFPLYDNLCRHPYTIYAAIYHFVIFGILLLMNRLKSMYRWRNGFIFAGFIFLYSLFRFITDFWREDIVKYGFTVWQIWSIIGMVAGLALFGYLIYTSVKKKENPIKPKKK